MFSSYSHFLTHKTFLKERVISLSPNKRGETEVRRQADTPDSVQSSRQARNEPLEKNISATAFIYGQNSYPYLPNPGQCLIQSNKRPFVVKQYENTKLALWALVQCENWSYNRNMEKHTGSDDRRKA